MIGFYEINYHGRNLSIAYEQLAMTEPKEPEIIVLYGDSQGAPLLIGERTNTVPNGGEIVRDVEIVWLSEEPYHRVCEFREPF